MLLKDLKVIKRMDKFLNKVFKMFPEKYLDMMSNVTSSNEKTNVQKQQGGDLLSFSPHPNKENVQQETQHTFMSKCASKTLTVIVPQKSTFETINNPLFNATPLTQDQMMATQMLTGVPQQEVIPRMPKIGSKSKMQESFMIGMPDLMNVQNNSTMQQSSYVPSSSIRLANTQVPIMQNIVTDPLIVVTQRATNSGVHQ